MLNTFFLGLATLCLFGLTVAFGYFTSFVYQNPSVFDDFKDISKYSQVLCNIRVTGKSFQLLKLLYNVQQKMGSKRLIVSREGWVCKEIGEKLEQTTENLILKVLELSNVNEIDSEKMKIFENLILDIPITYLRPSFGPIRFNTPYDVSVTPEGAAFINLKSD